jgi:hypothetical protein
MWVLAVSSYRLYGRNQTLAVMSFTLGELLAEDSASDHQLGAALVPLYISFLHEFCEMEYLT